MRPTIVEGPGVPGPSSPSGCLQSTVRGLLRTPLHDPSAETDPVARLRPADDVYGVVGAVGAGAALPRLLLRDGVLLHQSLGLGLELGQLRPREEAPDAAEDGVSVAHRDRRPRRMTSPWIRPTQ